MHFSKSPSDNVQLFLVVALLIYMFLRRVQFHPFNKEKVEVPILSADNMLNEGSLTSLKKGEMEGFTYNFMTNSAGRVMVLVDLGNNTGVHLIAMGDKSQFELLVRAQIANNFLKKVILEGDFPEYFKVYASPEKEVEIRQIMEPRNMAQFVDFCRAYSVEIFHESMYISQAQGDNDKADPTLMTEDLEVFLKANAAMLKRL